MAVSFKGAHFPPEIILMGVRWYLAYPLSTRHVEELMEERGIDVDHATINESVKIWGDPRTDHQPVASLYERITVTTPADSCL
jgi:transposase-like protein